MTGSGGRVLIGVAVLVAAVVAGVVLVGRATPTAPFSVTSTAPEGYAALAEVLADRGVLVRERTAQQLLDALGETDATPGRAVVVPVPAQLPPDAVDALGGRAAGGARVVYGSPPEGPALPDELEGFEELVGPAPLVPPGRFLADVEAVPQPPGTCDLAVLEGLGPVDAAFAEPVPVPVDGSSCYGDGGAALFVADAGSELVTMAGPLLWSNARLQPAKEDGGAALDNAATALALLGDADEVWFVDTSAAGGRAPGGTQDPLSLLPLPVQLALAQLIGALVLFVWWRARRLGRPPVEPLPVEIAGSELVVAVGDVMRRRSARARVAAELRLDTRRQLCAVLGLGVDAPPDVLVTRLVGPTGRSVEELTDTLYGAGEPDGDGPLVDLAHRLDRIRQEVLDVRTVR